MLYIKKSKIDYKMQRGSSAFYKLKFILIVHFMFSKKANSLRPIFTIAKSGRAKLGAFLNTKSTQIKQTVLCKL
jgi:hypothetical protein